MVKLIVSHPPSPVVKDRLEQLRFRQGLQGPREIRYRKLFWTNVWIRENSSFLLVYWKLIDIVKIFVVWQFTITSYWVFNTTYFSMVCTNNCICRGWIDFMMVLLTQDYFKLKGLYNKILSFQIRAYQLIFSRRGSFKNKHLTELKKLQCSARCLNCF